jgi:hypothetical protein
MDPPPGARPIYVIELDRRELAESALPSSAVVGAFDPGNDREAELVAARPALAVEDVLLEQREPRLHRGVVRCRRDAPHRADEPVAA